MQERLRNRLVIIFLLIGNLFLMGAGWLGVPLIGFLGLICLLIALIAALIGWNDEAQTVIPPSLQARNQTQKFLEDISKTISFPFLILGSAGRISFMSDGLTSQFPNLKIGDHFSKISRGRPFVDAVHAAMDGQQVAPFQISLQRGAERVFEIVLVDLSERPLEGLDAMILVEILDRTDERRSDVFRRDFIANASHELRTPLSSILGGLETIQANDDAKTVEHFLPIMTKEATRMLRLLEDMMALSRVEMTEHYAPSQLVNLRDILDTALAALGARGAFEAVEIDNHFKEDFMLKGDEDQLLQVLTNILDNAVKYSKAPAKITIDRVKSNPAHPRLTGLRIKDNGPGMDPIHIPRLTERFYRVSELESRNKGGTGLGLAIVKHMLLRHQGELQIQSKLGEGSAFTIWLPEEKKSN